MLLIMFQSVIWQNHCLFNQMFERIIKCIFLLQVQKVVQKYQMICWASESRIISGVTKMINLNKIIIITHYYLIGVAMKALI